jgi:hypothetical protein
LTRATITEHYVLVETDDIDFSVLRQAVKESQPRPNRRVASIEELPVEILEQIVEELTKEL